MQQVTKVPSVKYTLGKNEYNDPRAVLMKLLDDATDSANYTVQIAYLNANDLRALHDALDWYLNEVGE